jgi:hypothetical protein
MSSCSFVNLIALVGSSQPPNQILATINSLVLWLFPRPTGRRNRLDESVEVRIAEVGY